MSKKITEADLKRVREVIDYDPLTGLFQWSKNRRGIRKGQIAGSFPRKRDSHMAIYIHRKKYYAHRLAWFISHGYFPVTIDHIDRDPTNNRLDNLRAAESVENSRNSGIYKNNKSGFKGVSWNEEKSKWKARIKVYKIEIHLGYFIDKREAAHEYNKAAIKWHGEFACLNPL